MAGTSTQQGIGDWIDVLGLIYFVVVAFFFSLSKVKVPLEIFIRWSRFLYILFLRFFVILRSDVHGFMLLLDKITCIF